MLKVLIPTIMLLASTWLTPPRHIWLSALSHSLIIALVGLSWFSPSSMTSWSSINPYLATDSLSTPLLVLSCWLLPLMILASQKHISIEPLLVNDYLSLLITLQVFLILAFGATELIMFYIMFEATQFPP